MPLVNEKIPTYCLPSASMLTIETMIPSFRFSFGEENTPSFHVESGFMLIVYDIPIDGSTIPTLDFPYGFSVPPNVTHPFNNANVLCNSNTSHENNM